MTVAKRIQKIETTFEREAEDWDGLARRYQTRYDEMLEELVSRVRTPRGGHILDLGSGSGILAEILLERFPNSHVTLLDISANMLEVGKRRLERFEGRTSYVQGMFEGMPMGPYDAVVSTLALHHLEDDSAKQTQYERIFSSLKAGGCFFQGEYTLCSDTADSEQNEEAWQRWLGEQGFNTTEVEELAGRVRENDRPATLIDQLDWLKSIGFQKVDCTWRYTKFAVFGGRKAS